MGRFALLPGVPVGCPSPSPTNIVVAETALGQFLTALARPIDDRYHMITVAGRSETVETSETNKTLFFKTHRIN